jgi:hypothetical protein
MENLVKNFSCVEKSSQQTQLILEEVGGYETDSFKLVWMNGIMTMLQRRI